MEHVTFSVWVRCSTKQRQTLPVICSGIPPDESEQTYTITCEWDLIFFLWNWRPRTHTRTMAAAPWRLLLHQGLGVVKAVKTPFNYFPEFWQSLFWQFTFVFQCFCEWMRASSCLPLCFTDITLRYHKMYSLKDIFHLSQDYLKAHGWSSMTNEAIWHYFMH